MIRQPLLISALLPGRRATIAAPADPILRPRLAERQRALVVIGRPRPPFAPQELAPSWWPAPSPRSTLLLDQATLTKDS